MQTADKKKLLQQAHNLHPVVRIGNKGLTEAVHIEIERALTAHQLIKIKVPQGDNAQRKAMFNNIADYHDADFVHAIGFVGVFYRPKRAEKN
ncbi:MAG: YhbY family RNA-binding protein [Pseudomonadota bacterium]